MHTHTRGRKKKKEKKEGKRHNNIFKFLSPIKNKEEIAKEAAEKKRGTIQVSQFSNIKDEDAVIEQLAPN